MAASVLFPGHRKGFAYLESTGFDQDTVHRLIDGEPVDPNAESDFTIRNGRTLPDLLGTGASEFLVRERFKQRIQELCPRADIAFVPFEVLDEQFWLINVLGHRAAMDLERSEYTEFDDGYPDEITRLVILDDVVDGYDIFRLDTKPTLILVTHDLRDALTADGFTGLQFMDGVNLEVLKPERVSAPPT